jgi:hypothetical protein
MLIINNDAMRNGTGGHKSIVSVADARRNLIVFRRSRTNSVIRRDFTAIVIHITEYTSQSALTTTEVTEARVTCLSLELYENVKM